MFNRTKINKMTLRADFCGHCFAHGAFFLRESISTDDCGWLDAEEEERRNKEERRVLQLDGQMWSGPPPSQQPIRPVHQNVLVVHLIKRQN